MGDSLVTQNIDMTVIARQSGSSRRPSYGSIRLKGPRGARSAVRNGLTMSMLSLPVVSIFRTTAWFQTGRVGTLKSLATTLPASCRLRVIIEATNLYVEQIIL